MAKRRKFLAGLGALATGSTAAIGTGALSVTQSGTAQVTVSSSNSLAEVDANTSSDYITDTNPVTIDISNNGNGVPEMSNTVIQPAFTVSNTSSEKLYAEILNPFANTDMTTAGGAAGTGVGDKAIAGVDVQFIATTAGTEISASPNRNAALIGRDELPNGNPLGAGFDDPGSNAQFFLQGSGFSLSNSDRTSLQNSGKTQAGYLEIDPAQSFDVIYQIAAQSPGDVDLSEDFEISVTNDESDMNLSNRVDDHLESP